MKAVGIRLNKSVVFAAAFFTIIASILAIYEFYEPAITPANAQNTVGNITAGRDVFINQGKIFVIGGDPSQPNKEIGLSSVQTFDLKRLLSAALAHYKKHKSRFERRINGDLKRLYENEGIIKRYGEPEKTRQSDLSEIDRIPVAIAYRKIVEEIIDTYNSTDGKKGALAKTIKNL